MQEISKFNLQHLPYNDFSKISTDFDSYKTMYGFAICYILSFPSFTASLFSCLERLLLRAENI